MTTPLPSTECCPPFDPAPWHDKTFEWQSKKFIKDHVTTIWYMPLNFGKVIMRMNSLVEKAGASMPDWLGLSDHTSRWNMDIYLAVDKDIPGAENHEMSGTFYSRVYEGPFRDTGKWGKDFEAAVKQKGLKTDKLFMWYTTCPKCAKKYGKNYVVFVGRVI